MRARVMMLFVLSATAGGASAPYRPPPVQARAHLNTLDVTARPGVLVATQGGQEVWRRRGPLARPTRLELLNTGRELLLLSEDSQRGDLTVSAYAPASGRLLWENKVLNRFANASGHLAGHSGRTLVVLASSGEPLAGRVLGVSLDTGTTLWTGRQDLLGFTDREVLLIDLGLGAQPMNSADVLPLTRIVAATGETTALSFRIPFHLNSGAPNYQGSIPDVRFTGHFLYAFRQDAGGRFIVRYDWHGSPAQTPLVYRDRRPPVPARAPAPAQP